MWLLVSVLLLLHANARLLPSVGAFASSRAPLKKNGGIDHIAIEQVALDDGEGLAAMSRFCIDAFYGDDVDAGTLWSRKWKGIKLAALQKAQLLEISLSNAENRCIFVAKNNHAGNYDEIVGCCEVIEERLDTHQLPMSNRTMNERERRKTARPRPVIENLCVQPEYRRAGVGMALVRACEEAVGRWSGHSEIFAQVEESNTNAVPFFRSCGYSDHFADPTCTKVTLDGALFGEETVTKLMMRKILEDGSEMF